MTKRERIEKRKIQIHHPDGTRDILTRSPLDRYSGLDRESVECDLSLLALSLRLLSRVVCGQSRLIAKTI